MRHAEILSIEAAAVNWCRDDGGLALGQRRTWVAMLPRGGIESLILGVLDTAWPLLP